LNARQQANGWRYLLVGRLRLAVEAEKTYSHKQGLKNAQSPTSQVHVLLGAGTLTSATPGNCQHEAFAAQREAGFHDWKACLTYQTIAPQVRTSHYVPHTKAHAAPPKRLAVGS
jgi:hypothetical protein